MSTGQARARAVTAIRHREVGRHYIGGFARGARINRCFLAGRSEAGFQEVARFAMEIRSSRRTRTQPISTPRVQKLIVA